MTDLIPVIVSFYPQVNVTFPVRYERRPSISDLSESVVGNKRKYLSESAIEDMLLDLSYTRGFWYGWESRDEEAIREWIQAIRVWDNQYIQADNERYVVKGNGVLNNIRYTVRHLLRNGVAIRRIIDAIKDNKYE